MYIDGDIEFAQIGGQLVNACLHNLSSDPTITTTGKIYFNTSSKKVRVWSGTAWLEFGPTSTYKAGSGLLLDSGTGTFSVNLGYPNVSGLEFGSGSSLKLKVESTEFDLDGDGLSLKTGGIVGDHIADGTIQPTKLQYIDIANLVAGVAVEPDYFIRKNIDDSTTGQLTVGTLVLTPRSSAPLTTTGGLIYYSSVDGYLYYWDDVNTQWQQVINSVTVGVQTLAVIPPLFETHDLSGNYTLSISQADTLNDGYLTAVDWNIFNNKQDALVFGRGTEVDGVTIYTDTPYSDTLVILLHPVTFTNSSQNISTASGFWNRLYPGHWIKPTAGSTWYQVQTVTSDSTATITHPYTGSTATVPSTVRAWQGLNYTDSVTSAKLQLNLHPNGSLVIDPLSGGLKVGLGFAGWQAVWDVDPNKVLGYEHFMLDPDAQWAIKTSNGLYDIIQVDDVDGSEAHAKVTLLNTIVSGNFEAQGDYGYLNVDDVRIKDRTILVGWGTTGIPLDAWNANFEVDRGALPNVDIRWNEQYDRWEFTNDGSTYDEIGSGRIKHVRVGVVNVASVIVNHLFNDTTPHVVCYDTAGYMTEPNSVQALDANNVEVTFSPNFTGSVSVMGGLSNAGTIFHVSDTYSVIFNLVTAPYTLTIHPATHNLGYTDNIMVYTYDNGVPRQVIYPNYSTISLTGTVTVNFSGPQSGKLILIRVS